MYFKSMLLFHRSNLSAITKMPSAFVETITEDNGVIIYMYMILLSFNDLPTTETE